jgi:RNA polymerase sigma factor (sigma-70 family)
MENSLEIGEALMERFRSGDDLAFDEIDRAYRKRIWSVCDRVLLDRFAADDVTQLTFIKIWMHHDDYALGRPLWPWVRSIALRSCLDWIRAEDRMKDHGFDTLVECIKDGEWTRPVPTRDVSQEITDPVELSEWRDAFRKCWSELTESQRFTLQCVDWSDLKRSWRIISERTSKEPTAVRMAVLRAGRALVMCISEKGFRPTYSEFLAMLDERNLSLEKLYE